MSCTSLLITPPFCQCNTPYPATPYLKGFLNTLGETSMQRDLGLEVLLRLFSKRGLSDLFKVGTDQMLSGPAQRVYSLRQEYIDTIDDVLLFLQNKNPTLAFKIVSNDWLPISPKQVSEEQLAWAFGSMGTQDLAKYIATTYLEDLGEFITECVDPHFGFSRYAEQLGRSAGSFDALYEELQRAPSYLDQILFQLLQEEELSHQLILISVPFPGNLYAAFRIAQWYKQHCPHAIVVMGGGFPNTELRSLNEARVFDFFDFITLDDGERPLELLLKHIRSGTSLQEGVFKRTFACEAGKVMYLDNSEQLDYRQELVGTPDYSDLKLDQYLSFIEVLNPMHRLWNDGRWNKLTLAHGCYWGKCTFCDTSLDYIKRYEPNTAPMICDRMEELMAQTGQNGFHFVDEAAPPKVMRELALEILRRRLSVTWWANIRFEKSFTGDLCRLLKSAGCVAVSGGLEVASPRILQMIEKGVHLKQVAQVCGHFADANILVHAYLMYGFPTQTEQETVDSLEVVRQLFEQGLIQSGYWHQFALTAHSPVGLNPEKYGVTIKSPKGSFANNDLEYLESSPFSMHDRYSLGLKKSLYNFMNGLGFDLPLSDWFAFKTPNTSIEPNYMEECLEKGSDFFIHEQAQVLWVGNLPELRRYSKNKKGRVYEMVQLDFHHRSGDFSLQLGEKEGDWLLEVLKNASLNGPRLSMKEVEGSYQAMGLEDFKPLWFSKPMNTLRSKGLLMI